MEACHEDDYNKAAQYLDLNRILDRYRAQQGAKLAKDLESLLNSASSFDVLQLNQNPEGNLADDLDPNIEHVTTVTSNGQRLAIELERTHPANGLAIWLVSADTVVKIPALMPISTAESKIEARLPRFLVATLLLDTPLWKWIALLLVAFLLFVVFRVFVRLFNRLVRSLHLSGKAHILQGPDPAALERNPRNAGSE